MSKEEMIDPNAVNEVDTDDATIEAELDNIASEFDINDIDDEAINNDTAENLPILNAAQLDNGRWNPDHPDMASKVSMAESSILTGLEFVFSGLMDLDVNKEHYKKVATAYAKVIIYYYGDFFTFLERWKYEGSAIMSTLMLVKEIKKASAKKQATEHLKDPQETGPQ